MKIALSSSHSKYLPGAVDFITERDESRRVVEKVAEYLRTAGVDLTVIHDDVSKDRTANLKWLVAAHNKIKGQNLDVSIHFNSDDKGTTDSARGTEVWYRTQAELATRISAAISKASGLIDRGKKYGNWTILTDTSAPAVLIEVCFVNSRADVALYQRPEIFDAICRVIAESLTGKTIAEISPAGPSSAAVIPPELRRGSTGETVKELQRLLNQHGADPALNVDGDFGIKTEAAVKEFQSVWKIYEGIVASETWGKLKQ